MQQIHSSLQRPEYAIAFRSIRAAKNLAAFLIILCLLAQIGSTVAVHFARFLDEPGTVAASQPPTPPAAVKTADSEYDVVEMTRVGMEFGLPGTRFGAMVLCLLLVLMVMFAVKLSLVERIGGVAGFISAFNWSLILLMMLIPWKPILGSSFSCGALFTYSELINADAALGDAPTQIEQGLFYARFLAYPCLALLTCLVVQVKFARGFSAADFRLDASQGPVAS